MKRIKYITLILITLFIFKNNAFAALNVSRSSITAGESFTASVSFRAASWNIHISANGPVSGCRIDAVDDTGDLSTINKTVSVNCTSTGKGTITVRLTGDYAIISNGEIVGTNLNETRQVTVNARQQTQTPVYTQQTYKSANNNLSNLVVEGYTLDKEFNSGTTEYAVLVPNGTTEVNIIATKADNKASVTGTGKKTVSDGPNPITVVVTAESGAKKTYTIVVTVEEKAIPVRINGEDYTFIRKADNLPKVSSYYSVTKTTYEDNEVAAYYSDVTNYLLVGLKDDKGNSNLYIYDPDKHSFILYNEINLGNIAVYSQVPSSKDMIPDLKESPLVLDDVEYNAYQFDLDSDYYLIYGTNVNTNNTGWFMYDEEENTLQRYNMNEIVNLSNQRDKLILIVKLLCTLFIISLLSLTVIHKIFTKKES